MTPEAPLTLPDLLEISLTQQADAWWFHARIKDVPGARAEVARLVAIDIVARLCDASVEAFGNWMDRYSGGPERDEATKAELTFTIW